MRNTTIFFILRRDGKEVRVHGFNIVTMPLCEHIFQRHETLFVSFECKQLQGIQSRSGSLHWHQGKQVNDKRTLPLLRMIAHRCDVLFPGAAVASMTSARSLEGGERMCAGKQEALS